TPSAGLLGTEGDLNAWTALSASTITMSVKVPPASTPMRTGPGRCAVMGSVILKGRGLGGSAGNRDGLRRAWRPADGRRPAVGPDAGRPGSPAGMRAAHAGSARRN